MTGIYYLIKQRYVQGLLLIANILGTVYGFYWYAFQVSQTPPALRLFVPDSPMASLFFCIALAGIMIHRRLPLFEALAAVTLVKYGVWAVGMNAVSGYFGYPLRFPEYMLIASHGCMALEAVFFAKYFRFKRFSLIVAAVWTLNNDFIDYLFKTAPWYPYLDENLQSIGYLTFWLSILSIGLVYVLVFRRERLSFD